jgi:hypothetical protein
VLVEKGAYSGIEAEHLEVAIINIDNKTEFC